jgi:hypothetical protein
MSKVLKFLTAEAFHTPPALKFEDVPLPEFGEGAGVRILELDGESAQRFGEVVAKEEDKFAMPLWIIASAHTVVPKMDNGEPVFEDAEKTKPVLVTGEPVFTDSKETRARILNMGASIVMRLGNTALKLNGFTKDETEKETKN